MASLKMGSLNSFYNSNFSEELKWQLALEYSNIGVWEYDAILNRVFFSKESKQIIGVDNADFGVNPQDWNNLVHPEDRAKYFKDFQDHLNGLKPMYENEHRVKVADGSYKWILDKGKIVEWSNNGKAKRVIGTHTDITKLKESETKINEALIIATEQNNRLKNFAHIVTHNLKQHTGNFESLLSFFDDAKTSHEKNEIISHLKSLSTSLTKTITNLNDIVSVQASKNKKVEKIFIAKEINSVLKMLDIVISKSNATVNNKVNDKIYIYYNASYLESVIQNLLTNAIKYRHPDRDPIINIEYTFDSEKIELIISDNGLGIDLDKYGKDIFGLYKTFHFNDDAEGVGLYLIKNQIETFGGKIRVDSQVNVGTTFTITIPNV